MLSSLFFLLCWAVAHPLSAPDPSTFLFIVLGLFSSCHCPPLSALPHAGPHAFCILDRFYFVFHSCLMTFYSFLRYYLTICQLVLFSSRYPLILWLLVRAVSSFPFFLRLGCVRCVGNPVPGLSICWDLLSFRYASCSSYVPFLGFFSSAVL